MIALIFRKNRPEFNSIENVFNTLIPFLNSYIAKHELPFFSLGIVNRIKNILFVRNLNKRFIHITGYDNYLIIGLLKTKAILTIHDIEILQRNKGLKLYLLRKIWFDWPISRAKVITTISEFSKREILTLNNYKTPIKVIHNPLTLPLSFHQKSFNTTSPSILHLGIKANKNLSNLIIALKGINCRLIIIGKPNASLKQKLVENKIDFSFKSNLTNKEMVDEYRNCDFLSFISLYEGFGLPIIEAQAIGRPVITSNCASMPEVAGKGAILVNPHSVDEIREGILKIINNVTLRENLIKEGLENIKRFEPKKIAQQYIDLYKEVLDGR